MVIRRPLRDYQKLMLRYCLKVKHPALFVQMRLGKTIVAIRSVKVRGGHKILVVAPYSALYGWSLELDAEGEESKGVTELYGERKERLEIINSSYTTNKWFLINKEGHRTLPEISDYYFDTIIIDESTFIKGPSSQTTDFYINNFRDAEHRYILTGTPAPESELDYFCQLRFLDWSMWDENNFWQFRHKNFGIIHYTPYIKPDSSQYLEQTLAKNCYFLTRANVKLGGRKIYEKRMIKLTRKVRKIYEKVEREFILSYMGKEQETIYAPTKYIWLRRLCGGFADQEFISYVKIKELASLLTGELHNEQVVVLCKHVNEVKMLTKYFSTKYSVGMIYGGVNKRKRPEIYKAFQSGDLDLLIAQSETVKHGVNLSASDTVVFYTSPDGGESREQAEDRIVNTATNDSSLIVDLVCQDTIEEDVMKNLVKKEGRQAMMRNTVQRLQKKYNLLGV
jgi:SNF2 family DNA or RNA helicase